MLALVLLQACKHPEPGDSPALDADGDGVSAPSDCDDADATVFPGADEVGGDGVDHDCDGLVPPAAATLAGLQVDEGYGHRVQRVGGADWVGAPFAQSTDGARAGRLYRDGVLVREGDAGDLLGAALAALDDGTVLVGAAGSLSTSDGAALFEEAGAGTVLAARGTSWVVSTATGAMTSGGARLEWGARPDALAILEDGTVVAGFARGDVAVRLGDTAIVRAAARDEAGAALLVGDVDGDGDEDVIVGAPGSGALVAFDPAAPPDTLADATLLATGTGRFGAALALAAPGELWVGAPGDGADFEGSAIRVGGGGRFTGGAAGAQLGFALSAADDAVLIGAPGAAGDTGRVERVVP